MSTISYAAFLSAKSILNKKIFKPCYTFIVWIVNQKIHLSKIRIKEFPDPWNENPPRNLPESTILEGSHDIFAAVLSANANETRIRFLFVDICLVESDYIWVVTSSCDLKIKFITWTCSRENSKTHLCFTSSHFVIVESSAAFGSNLTISGWKSLFWIHESFIWFMIYYFECK